MTRMAPVWVACAWLFLRPELALACGVCGAADDNSNTFLASTVFLSLLPLAMIFGGGYALYYASSHPELFEA